MKDDYQGFGPKERTIGVGEGVQSQDSWEDY